MTDIPRKGLIILGMPRSGTTLLRRLFDAHSDVACPGETFLLKASARFIRAETIGHGVDYGALGGLQAAGFEEAEVLGRLRELCFGFMDDIAKRAGKPRWAIKTAVDSFYLEEVEKIYGEHAQFVCVLRHGLDVITSLKEFSDEMQTYVEELHNYVREESRPLDAFARAWADVSKNLVAFSGRHPQNTCQIRYEDLVAEPETTLREVFDFANLAWEDGLLDRALNSKNVDGIGDWKSFQRASIDGNSVNRWQDLPDSTVRRLAPIVDPVLKLCGYEPIGVTDEEDERRRHELAMMLMKSSREA